MNKLYIFAVLLLTACSSNNGTAWDSSYGGADKSYDTALLSLREEIAPTFQTLQFVDTESGQTMDYNLFIPTNYDANKSYPLVLFMADASTVEKGVKAPLMQGYGGIIWATPESQANDPSFVLVPSYAGPDNAVNDDWEVTAEGELTLRLLDSVVNEYNIDKNRLYTTGQSMGGMLSFYFNATNPDLFAASIFVGSQWDVNLLKPLTQMKFFYIVSEADSKASAGMQELGEMLTANRVEFGQTKFSAQLPKQMQNDKINELLAQGYDINFVEFSEGTVVPANSRHGGAEHMYSFDYAYQLDTVRDWLFQQRKTP